MSREYRVIVEVGAREDTVAERSEISVIASDLCFHETLPEDWDNGREGADLVLFFEGTMTLGGGQTEAQEHAEIRGKFLGRSVTTCWWYLEGPPDESFSDEATEPVEAEEA